MKAIETRYKGYRFRSRLEARWAVFFDTLEWPWEYEPEAYGDGKIGYLPDFLLGPWSGKHGADAFFFEVKPESGPLDIEHALKQWSGLIGGTRKVLAVAFGTPWSHAMIHFDKNGAGVASRMFVCPCCGGPLSIMGDLKAVSPKVLSKFAAVPAYERACNAAKSARFDRP